MGKSQENNSVLDIKDLRDWLKAVESYEELQTVKGADWNLEIGCISELNYRRRPNPAQIFDEIKGYPKGYRILTSSIGSTRRMAITFRLSPELDDQGLVREIQGKPLEWENASPQYPPQLASP